MPEYTKSEQFILSLFPQGSTFNFNGKEFTVTISGKPRPSRGECKTDVYIEAVAPDNDAIEIKISIKQSNADFLENKISLSRAIEIFGKDAQNIITGCTLPLYKKFTSDPLIYFDSFGKTEAHTLKLGWKFELVNKLSGEKSGELMLDEQQKHDVFARINLPAEKKDCFVNGIQIPDSGVANYILNLADNNISRDQCIAMLQPIADFAKSQRIYFACKALNYRFDKDKWDGPRPLAVYVNWTVSNDMLNANLVFDRPLELNGNDTGEHLKSVLSTLKINRFDDLRNVLSPDLLIYP